MIRELTAYYLVCIIYLTIWLCIYIGSIVYEKKLTMAIVYIVFYIFHGVPLFLDLFVSPVIYSQQFTGFILSYSDYLTNVIYIAYLFFIPLVFWLFGVKKRVVVRYDILERTQELRKRYERVIYFIVGMPFIFIMVNFGMWKYLLVGYGTLDTLLIPSEAVDFRSSLANLVNISSLSLIFLLYLKGKTRFLDYAISTVLLVFFFYLNGKRYIIAETLMICFFAIQLKGKLRGRTTIALGSVMLVVLIWFSNYYQYNFRQTSTLLRTDSVKAYENFRIDFGRDDVVRMSIYQFLNDKPILEYPGQSFLFNFVAFVPRTLWEDKPWPYSVYFMSELLGISKTEYIGWGMTTSILDEMISNFGFMGFVLGPLLISRLCKISDNSKNDIFKLLTCYICIMLLSVHAASFLPQLYLWLFILVRELPKKFKVQSSNGVCI